MKMHMTILWTKAVSLGLGVALIILFTTSSPAFSAGKILSETDFTGFTTGVSVNGQGGWGIGGINGYPAGVTVDEEVTDIGGGNIVWRLSNSVVSGNLNDMPFAPRPAGIPTTPGDTSTNPVLGQPDMFAGEASTTAEYRRFTASLDFRSVTGATQPGLNVSVSADNGCGGRMSFVRLVDSGTGIDVVTFDVDAAGDFVGPLTIATGLSYTDWHHLSFVVRFWDGPSNDVVRIYLDGALIHTGTSWEDYFTASQHSSYPLGVPVQTIVFSTGSTAVPENAGYGFYFDNVITELSLSANAIPTLSQWGQILFALGLMGAAVWHWRKKRTGGRHQIQV